jgi:hypothetical protein
VRIEQKKIAGEMHVVFSTSDTCPEALAFEENQERNLRGNL